MHVAVEYLVERNGAAFMLNSFVCSREINDALGLEVKPICGKSMAMRVYAQQATN
jgi:hypothetical protein